jgi:hypothetical protein
MYLTMRLHLEGLINCECQGRVCNERETSNSAITV